MKKVFLFALLCAATAMFAETRVENFTPKDGAKTPQTYMAEPTTKECSEASWTVFYGGIQQNLGKMGNSNWAAVVRAKYATTETYEGWPYIMSDSIEGGIDSLWFTWNSNGGETGQTWNIKVYVNDEEVGSIEEKGKAQIASAPFNTFQSKANINVKGKFVIKIVNESVISVDGNKLRLVVDDLGWITIPEAGEKDKPTFEFAEDKVLKKIDAEAFSVALTNTSDATPVFESSDPEVAKVDQEGLVTLMGVGTATITASVAETETYKAAEASYTIRVVPMNFHLETFDGAQNATGNATYLSNDSVAPTSDAGITWTTHLGSIRDNLGGSSMPTTNIAAAIRAKKTAEENYGYLLSSTIEGGIDSLAFDWTCNGNESARENPWNIKIYINDEEVGVITDACTAIPAKPYRYTLGNLKIDGDFTLKIENLNDADDGTGNHYRWVVDNIEWYSYEKPCTPDYGIMVDDKDYIAGEYNAEQTEWLEYKIVADLEAKQTIKLYDNCAKESFLPTGQEEGGYWFNVEEGVWSAPHKGTYTIYLKMYGPDNNWIWTSYEAPKYKVTIVEPTNGTLVVMDGAFEVKTGGMVQVNKTLTIIPTPAEGYQIASVTANGDKIEPQEGGYYHMMSYVDVEIAATFEEACSGEYGLRVNGEKYIAGEYNAEQTEWLEYKIVANLKAKDKIELYDNCAKEAFLPTGQDEGGYWFNVEDEVWSAPADGEYTIYLKMYGPNNNWIWTSCKPAGPSTGIENASFENGVRKAVENGVVVIYRNGVRYNLQGQNF